jgi:hypothetical protein
MPSPKFILLLSLLLATAAFAQTTIAVSNTGDNRVATLPGGGTGGQSLTAYDDSGDQVGFIQYQCAPGSWPYAPAYEFSISDQDEGTYHGVARTLACAANADGSLTGTASGTLDDGRGFTVRTTQTYVYKRQFCGRSRGYCSVKYNNGGNSVISVGN